MRKSQKVLLALLIIIAKAHVAQPLGVQVPACDNEDFEASSAGVVTTTNAVNGWGTYKITNPNGICNNSVLTSSTTIYSVPDNGYVEVISAPNGYADPLIGPTYSVFSVFGSGQANSGSTQNSHLPNMFGNSFIRINKDGAVNTNHALEKTITVTSSNSLFRFAYLPVIQPKAGASCCEQPGIYIRFFNASGGNTVLPCPAYSLSALSSGCPSLPVPAMSLCPNATNTYYNKWKVHAFDLSPYIGSNITFKLAGLDCTTGCLHFGYAYVDAQCSPMQIFVNGTPFPAHTNSVTYSGCGVSSATVVAPPDFATYDWSGPGGFTSTLSTVVTSVSGVYTLNINASSTCSTITKYISITTHPSASVSASSSRSVLCVGEKAVITATGLSTYSVNGQSSAGIFTVQPTQTATYVINGKDANGCTASVSITQPVDPCLGVDEMRLSTEIVFSPNPNEGIFLVTTVPSYIGGTMEVRNTVGQLLFRRAINSSKMHIDLGEVLPGLYFVKLTCEKEIREVRSKFLISR